MRPRLDGSDGNFHWKNAGEQFTRKSSHVSNRGVAIGFFKGRGGGGGVTLSQTQGT